MSNYFEASVMPEIAVAAAECFARSATPSDAFAALDDADLSEVTEAIGHTLDVELFDELKADAVAFLAGKVL